MRAAAGSEIIRPGVDGPGDDRGRRRTLGVLDTFRLDGRRACVTGGSRGLGLAMARGLAEAGADLLLVGREIDTLHAARDGLAALGRDVAVLVADVGDPGPSEVAARRAVDEFGPIDILVN